MLHKTIVLQEGQNVYFTSDLHYGHQNICRGVSNWDLADHGENATRDFETLDEMNDALIDGINSTVGENDYLVVAGDVAFGGAQNIIICMDRIVCKNVILILGNHDHHIDRNKNLYSVERMVKAQDLFLSVHTHLILTVKHSDGRSTTYDIFHYPIVAWNKAHHGRVHLYGHVHNSYTHPGRALDVGMDSAFYKLGEYRPFSESDVQEYMSDREFKQFSHHNSKTN